MSEPILKFEFEGAAKIKQISKLYKEFVGAEEPDTLDIASILTKLLDNVMSDLSKLEEKTFVAKIAFKDSVGHEASFTVDIGNKVPPFSRDKVRARVIVEIYDDEPKEGEEE